MSRSRPYSPTLLKLYSQTAPEFYIVAHRGASYHTPENTMPAFRKAHELGADMIELDILLTRDRVPVVFHDLKVNRKTNGTGWVRDFTAKEITRLDAGSWFHKEFAGTRIPTLEEVIRWAAGKISLNIEVKKDGKGSPAELAEIVSGLIRKYRMETHVLVSSFSYDLIGAFKKAAPDVPTGLLYNSGFSDGNEISRLIQVYQADTFHCHWRQFNRRWKDQLQKIGIPVIIYTVNTKERMRQMIDMGVNGIFTDRPDLLRQVVTDQLVNKE